MACGGVHNAAMSEFDTFQRKIVIDAAPELIAAQLVDFRRWQGWSPWEGLDPDLNRTFTGPASGVGANYEWTGNRKAGAGQMKITEVSESVIRVALVFSKPFKSTSDVTFSLTPSDSGTEVVWTMKSPKSIGTKIFGLFMNMEKAIGGDLEKGLAGLKSLIENQ